MAGLLYLPADRMLITDIAAILGGSRRFIYKWAKRFVQAGRRG